MRFSNMANSMVQQGIRGIVYGRNVIQQTHPKAIVEALMKIVHSTF